VIHFDDLRRAVGDRLLVLGRDEPAERARPERTITEAAAVAQDQPDEAITVDARVERLMYPATTTQHRPSGIVE
jgi:hypothetical protein